MRTPELLVSLAADALDPEHPAHPYMKRRNAETLTFYADRFRKLQAARAAPADLDTHAVARQLVAIHRGLQSQWLLDPDFDLAAEIRQASRRLTGQAMMEAKQAVEDLIARL